MKTLFACLVFLCFLGPALAVAYHQPYCPRPYYPVYPRPYVPFPVNPYYPYNPYYPWYPWPRAIGAEVTIKNVGLKDLKEKMKELRKDKVLLVEVWGSWCGPCRLQTPKTLALQAKHKDTLNLLLVSVAEREADGAARFLSRQTLGAGVTAVNYTGALDDLKSLLAYPGYVPYLVLVGKDGDLYEFSEDTIEALLVK